MSNILILVKIISVRGCHLEKNKTKESSSKTSWSYELYCYTILLYYELIKTVVHNIQFQ